MLLKLLKVDLKLQPSAAKKVSPSKVRRDSTDRLVAFISYRHVEPDRTWARWLHASLERYRVPKRLVRQRDLPRRIGRVFRDEEELAASPDLSAAIQQALQRAEYLVVVCSPETPKSEWVNAEIERFRALGRSDRILALLIDGEPGDAFPKALREIRPALMPDQGGSTAQIALLEPLAADVRPLPGESTRFRKRMAKLRLLATILGCHFDELRRREQERRNRILACLTAGLLLFASSFAGLGLYAEARRTDALIAESNRLATLSTRETDAGHTTRGILLALEALPRDLARPNRPYLQTAKWALLHAIINHREKHIIGDHEHQVRSAVFSPDGTTVVTASLNGTARLWDVKTGAVRAIFRGHEARVWCVAFRADGTAVVTGSEDGTARLWDTATGATLAVLRGHEARVRFAAFSPDGITVVTASEDGTARLWNAVTGAPQAILPGHGQWVTSATFSRDGKTVLTVSNDNTAWLWNTATGTPKFILKGHESYVKSAAFSPDGATVMTASLDGTARLWDAATGATLAVLRGHDQGDINTAAFSPDGAKVVTASWDRTARLWDAMTGQPLGVLRGHDLEVWSAVFSPDGTAVVTASDDGTARLWDVATGETRAILRGHGNYVRSAAFSPDGATIVTASEDGTARLWNTEIEIPGVVLRGGDIRAAAFSPDGTRVVTACADNTARIWDAATG
jgi:WD40 repeat protein